MLSKDLERALNESFKQARAQRHEFITVEHLLLALLDDSAAQAVLRDIVRLVADPSHDPPLGARTVARRLGRGRCELLRGRGARSRDRAALTRRRRAHLSRASARSRVTRERRAPPPPHRRAQPQHPDGARGRT